MEPDRAIEIVQKQADGVDPFTDERFPSSSPYQQADTVRALHLALEGLGKLKRSTARKTGPGRPWSEDEEKDLLRKFIIKVDLKVTHPQDPGPTGSAAKYSNTPTNGCADNLFSTWDNEQFRIDVQIAPSAVTSSLPSGFITWSTPGFTIPDDTTSYTFVWTNTGTKVVTNTCGGAVRMVHVDVPDVGTMTEAVAASRVGLAALFIRSYHTDAETYGGSFTGPESDARRHCYWNALGASSINVGAVNMAMLATGHERNNRLGITSNGAPAVPPGGPNQAYYCTMDLFNNSVGRGIVKTTWLGNPDTADIQSQIDTLFSSGNLWIWDGTGMWSADEGILMKSDGTKIY